MKLLVMDGGISKDSLNQKLYKAMKSHAPKGIEIVDYPIENLPFFSQDLESDLPQEVQDFKKLVKGSDAVLFITPEYNRSIPGVLKNAIDWASRPYGKSEWDKKPAGVMGASVGNIGTFGAQHHLRQVLAYLNMPTMGQPEFYLNGSKSFNDKGELTDEKTKEFIIGYWDSFSKFCKFQH